MPSHPLPEFGRGVTDHLFERLGEMEDVAEAQLIGEFLEPVAPLVNGRAGPFDPPDLLIVTRG